MTIDLNIPDNVVRMAAEQIRAVAASCCETAALAAGAARREERNNGKHHLRGHAAWS